MTMNVNKEITNKLATAIAEAYVNDGYEGSSCGDWYYHGSVTQTGEFTELPYGSYSTAKFWSTSYDHREIFDPECLTVTTVSVSGAYVTGKNKPHGIFKEIDLTTETPDEDFDLICDGDLIAVTQVEDLQAVGLKLAALNEESSVYIKYEDEWYRLSLTFAQGKITEVKEVK